jgi:hypothetical protein
VEERIGIQLSDARWALSEAGRNLQFDTVYVEQMVQAMTEVAGYAIESGHDDLASGATQKATELEEIAVDNE